MHHPRRSVLLAASGIALVALVTGTLFAFHVTGTRAAAGANGTLTTVAFKGAASLKATGAAATKGGDTSQEISPAGDVGEEIPHSSTIVHVDASHVPSPAGSAIAASNAGFRGFAGLNHLDQRLAGTGAFAGTQFSLEPPDQALCAGNGFVFESINTAIRVFRTDGSAATAPIAINQFLGLAPEIIRGANPVFGDFTSDPKCYFDATTQRWFFTILQADVVPATGDFSGRTHVYIAVSQSSDPTGAYNLFVLDTTNDGLNGTPKHASCPCLGDQPLIGADANGFYVTTNEFPLFSNGFNGAQVYAVSKAALVAGKTPPAVTINAGALPTPDAGGIWYSIQPATVPAGGAFNTANGGTEYFLSALDFAGKLDNRIAVWALTNTASLGGKAPAVSLTNAVIASEVYGQGPAQIQKNGPTPFGDSVHSPEALLDGNDDRMNQVVFAGGKLWSAVDTVVQTPNGPTRAGVAYFVVSPSVTSGQVGGAMTGQGYVAVNQQNTSYPSIGVNAAGKALITFTLTGPGFFPSAAYATIDAAGNTGDVHIAAAGAGPEDGFTGYKSPGFGGTSRWGDYSAAVADADGSIWLAQEYIGQSCGDAQFNADSTCGGTRTLFANWGTFISNVQP